MAALFAPAMQAQSEVEFDQGIHFQFGITQEEFDTFASLFAQGIYATPVEPARARGLLGFDVGVAAAAVPVDTNAPYWTRSVNEDFTVSDHVVVPRLVASKGLSFGTISAMYAKVPDTDLQVWGASYDMPITSGGIASPTIALRGAYSQLRGSDELDLSTYGVEVFISKGFGPITPYAAAGYARHSGTANVLSLGAAPSYVLDTDGNMNRYTLGLKVSMFIPKLVVEATQGEERSYAAKVAFGF
ncbi:MAG TPA: hypothetical protein VFV49_14405 [Thermoanaerobaculia bacterium]|nr:hypothetical protein [Thermoanaerobaculia bacterium]